MTRGPEGAGKYFFFQKERKKNIPILCGLDKTRNSDSYYGAVSEITIIWCNWCLISSAEISEQGKERK